MRELEFRLLKSNILNKVTKDGNKYIIDYPCESKSDCTDYVFDLYPGLYKFELYGASGGMATGHSTSYRFSDRSCLPDSVVAELKGNTFCNDVSSLGGAGGYVSGVILLTREVTAYATIGGAGVYDCKINEKNNEKCFWKEYMNPGGYGGGGYSANFYSVATDKGTASGGGQTAVKFIENDLWHRVIVSGGGGGADNALGSFKGSDDGSGGAGGNLEAQGWWSNGIYVGNLVANSSFGFSFGSGESPRFKGSSSPYGITTHGAYYDFAGSGGGWFGGFASHDANGGSGGGSSWVLTKDAFIPEGEIEARDHNYTFIGKKKYQFDKTSGFLFNEVKHQAGIWEGNGKLVITILNNDVNCNTEITNFFHFHCAFILYPCVFYFKLN